MTDKELRFKVVNTAAEFVGGTMGSEKHKKLIDTYNTLSTLPRGYKVSYVDDYCATGFTAWFILSGLADIITPECGVEEMVQLSNAKGMWVEDDNHVPAAGDGIVFNYITGEDGKENTGRGRHIEIVENVKDGIIYCIGANNAGHVISREQYPVGHKYIRGFIKPNYKSKAEKEPSKKPKYAGEVYKCDRLNVRMGPGKTYGNLKEYPILAKGNRVDICDTKGNWYYIRIAGKHFGYVHKSYIKKVK